MTPPSHTAADLRLRGQAGPLRARLHRPIEPDGHPLLVLFPAGSIDRADRLCQGLCLRAGLMVIAASHRRLPAGLHDGVMVVEWSAEHATELGADPNRLLIGGEGIGGSLATSVAMHAREQHWPVLAGPLLINPDSGTLQGALSPPGLAPTIAITSGDSHYDDLLHAALFLTGRTSSLAGRSRPPPIP
ncbi:alpha/beta hydrolase [Nonomuraea insulae]|uniref:Alpha/beta hydrolase n=1 Tax=Nonomuraea insulae TaxID=1616787 RepID=A0ABW1D691_9ACTN